MLYFYIKFILNLNYDINYSKKTKYLSIIYVFPKLYAYYVFQTNEHFSEIILIPDKMNFSEPIKLHNSQVRIYERKSGRPMVL